MSEHVDAFGLTAEDFKKAERRVPVFAIWDSLSPEQLALVENNMIRASLLNPIQEAKVNDALAFEANLSLFTQGVGKDVFRYI